MSEDHLHPEWRGLLDPDEKILWQGAPDGELRMTFDAPMSSFMGLFFMLFSIVWMSMAAQAGGFFWTFGLLFLGVGFYNAIGVHIHDTWIRRHTFYTLTSKRAFIASRGLKGKSLESYPIQKDTLVRLEGDTPASVIFDQVMRGRGRGRRTVDIGFRYIDDARGVMSHIREIQSGAYK